jgi:hypothetical protein
MILKHLPGKLLAILLIGSSVSHAQEIETVKTQDTGAALVNPGMGWMMYFYSNAPANYGSHLLSPADTADEFPGLSTVFLRIPWGYLEPQEGKYNWALLDLDIFNRHFSWWPLAEGFMGYMARTQHLLQQGDFVADAAYFINPHFPALRSDPGALSGASRRKQNPCSNLVSP